MRLQLQDKIKYTLAVIKEYYHDFLERRQRIAMQKDLESRGVEIMPPFSISDENLFQCTSPVYIGPHATLYLRAPLKIGKGTIIGPRLTVHTANHCYEGDALPYDEYYVAAEVVIEENVWIGDNVTILPGVKIGEGAVIGANTLVSRDVPPMAIVGGNPCRVLKYRDVEKYRLNKSKGNIYLTLKREGKTEIDEKKRVKYTCEGRL